MKKMSLDGNTNPNLLLYSPHPRGRYMGGHGDPPQIVGGGVYWDIEILGVTYKLITSIVNRHLEC